MSALRVCCCLLQLERSRPYAKPTELNLLVGPLPRKGDKMNAAAGAGRLSDSDRPIPRRRALPASGQWCRDPAIQRRLSVHTASGWCWGGMGG